MKNRFAYLTLVLLLVVLALALTGCNRERPAPTPIGPTPLVKAGTVLPTPLTTSVTRTVLAGKTPQAAGVATPAPPTTSSPVPPTPIPVAPQAPAPTQPAPAQVDGETIYVVQRGDTLAKIAARHGVTIKQITDLNNITNPNFIYTGQKLRIPAPAPAATPAGGQTGRPRTYTVRAGDTLVAIATRFGVTVQAIQQLNNLANPDQIYTGQVLKIP